MKKIFLIGFMGSGKTTLGRQLAELMKIEFVDLDQMIEENESMTIREIFSVKGEKYFRMNESEMLKSLSNTNAVVAIGGGTPCYFNNMEWMNENGITVYLKVDSEILFERLKPEINHRPLLQNKSEEELLSFIKSKIAEREMFYTSAQIVVDANAISAAQLQEKLIK